MKKISDQSSLIDGWKQIQKRFKDISELAELDDENLRPELEAELGVSKNY